MVTAMTFQELVQRRLEQDGNLSASTRENYRELLSRYAYPTIKDAAASGVSTDMVVAIINKIDADRQSDIVKSAISSCYRWGMKRHLVKSNPCTGLGKRAPLGVRTNTLSTEQIKQFWNRTDTRELHMVLRLCLLTGQRRGEVLGAQFEELELTGDKPKWTIPGDTRERGKIVEGRTKNGKEQVVRFQSKPWNCSARANCHSDAAKTASVLRCASLDWVGNGARSAPNDGDVVRRSRHQARCH
jgi:integrase